MSKRFVLSVLWVLLALSSPAAPPERWDNQINTPARHDLNIWRGESINVQPRFLSYSAPWSISTASTVTLYYSTNNFTTTFATQGVVLATDTGRVSVLWSPACDAGALTYQYFIGISDTGLLYRASGLIRMYTSPGYHPSPAPLPVWDGWTNNYIYATYAALLNTSNALAGTMQAGFLSTTNWVMSQGFLTNAAGNVASVNGQTGVVTITAASIGSLTNEPLAMVIQTNTLTLAQFASGSNALNTVATVALTNGQAGINAAQAAANGAQSGVTAVSNLLTNAVAALTLGDALRVISPNTNAWTAVVNGTNYLYTVTVPVVDANLTSVTITITSPYICSKVHSYPISGTYVVQGSWNGSFTNSYPLFRHWQATAGIPANTLLAFAYPSGQYAYYLAYDGENGWNIFGCDNPDVIEAEGFWNTGSSATNLTATLNPNGQSLGTVVLTATPVTNATPLLLTTGSASGLTGCPSGADTNGAAAAVAQAGSNYALAVASSASNGAIAVSAAAITAATSGLVRASVTNGLVSAAALTAATQGLVTASVTNGLVSAAALIAATQGLVTASATNTIWANIYSNIPLAGANITLTPSASGVTIASTGGGGAGAITNNQTATATLAGQLVVTNNSLVPVYIVGNTNADSELAIQNQSTGAMASVSVDLYQAGGSTNLNGGPGWFAMFLNSSSYTNKTATGLSNDFGFIGNPSNAAARFILASTGSSMWFRVGASNVDDSVLPQLIITTNGTTVNGSLSVTNRLVVSGTNVLALSIAASNTAGSANVTATNAAAQIATLQTRLSADEALLDMSTFYDAMQSSLGGGSAWGQYWDGFLTTNGIAGGTNYLWSPGSVMLLYSNSPAPLYQYRCDDNAATTTFTDFMIGTNGTLPRNSSLMTTAGVVSTAIYINGAEYISIPNSSAMNFGANDFAVCWWEYKVVTGQWSISRDDVTYTPLLLGTGVGAIFMSGNGSTWGVASGRTFGSEVLNAWQHFVITRHGTTFFAYRNGVQQDTWTTATAANTTTAPWQIGRGQGANGFKGAVDDVRVYNRWVSPTDVTAIYNAGTGTQSTNIIYGGNLSITSTATSVTSFVPANFRVGMLVNDPTFNIVTNVDMIASATRDGGTTWSNAVLLDMGTIVGACGTNRYLLSAPQAFGGSAASNIALKAASANMKQGTIKAWILNAQP